MRIADWARRLPSRPELADILSPLDKSAEWRSVAYEARPVLLAAAYQANPRKMLVVTASYERALAWQAKLELCGVNRELICQLPSGQSALFEDAAPEHVALSDRLGALRALVEDTPRIILGTPQAVLERTLPRDVLIDAFIDLKPGQGVDLEQLINQLVNLGYEPAEPVRLPGQYSRRGGILDIYATGHDLPVRLELFGDDIESLRTFDPNTQRSTGNIPFLKLAPSRETLYTSSDSSVRDLVLDTMAREAASHEEAAARTLEELVSSDAEALAERLYFDRLDLYRPLLHPDSGCALDLLHEGELLVLDEPLELEAIISRAEEELGQALESRANRGEILHSPAIDFILPPEHLASHELILTMSAMNALPAWLSGGKAVDLDAVSLEPYRGRAEALAQTLKNYLGDGFEIVFSTDQPNRAKSVLSGAEIFVRESLGAGGESSRAGAASSSGGAKSSSASAGPSGASNPPSGGGAESARGGSEPLAGGSESSAGARESFAGGSESPVGAPGPSVATNESSVGAPAPSVATNEPSAEGSEPSGGGSAPLVGDNESFVGANERSVGGNGASAGAILALGNLGGGFVLPHLKLAVVTDAELFGVARLKLPQRKFREGAPIATLLDLKPGDFVVHIHFGIGIFRGLIKRQEHGVEKEFLYIEYQAPDKLFVPADQLDRIQKYLNPGDAQPKLNKLTGGEWQRTLGKAREEAKEFARDLVKLYAQRKRVQRRPFPPDTPFQEEMESTFPWVETPSQALAIKYAKKDLELPYPMDRLVCGDVGFGKTEVGIRAAFKVAQDGRQVAVLCPTTILSEQHFRNFSERLDAFGVRVALLNRYTHAEARTQILRQLKAGEIDILLGTHSLLGKGIEFKHLGLVIIDEEQKFGVKQKEMLKHLRTEVDVLTLSATPIPRTLSMALMDIRQMSLINDPPPGRLPIRTFVRPYAGEVVREAILREMARGGQVFYVYNRVESIGHVAEKLRKLVPHARIGVGHGQMTEKEIEPIMIGFIKGEIDVLLSTTIIENGIDISNANTLIVENADRLGLSQLYQLRGRVGRSDRQAYAYLLYGSGKEMSEGAMARLQALQEFSTLGSGYSLAFRDLQIRGAGELLGAKQSGTMANVGYELYTQLINEAVAMLKNAVDDSSAGVPSASAEDIADAELIDTSDLTPLPTFDVPVVALLPEGYIKDQAQRLYYYQRMMASRTENALGEVQAEVEDRYGHLTEEVSNAFAVMGQRIRARGLGIEKLDAKQGRLNIQFRDRTQIPPRLFSILGNRKKDAYLTREAYIWPYTGNPILAIEKLMQEMENGLAQIERERESLGV